ncbi:MAG: ArnT family glycosyltransferase [Fimbriimonadaceae bacterium]
MPDSANSLTKDRPTWLIVLALASVHIALALWFASITPYRTGGRIGGSIAPDIGAPDERAHANYIQRLLDGKGLPFLDVKRMGQDPQYRAEQYESHQPPLFYVLAAGWCKVMGVSQVDDPTVAVRFRSVNALIGAATVVAVYCAAYWGFKRADLAIAAALFPALLPMNVALSGAISNDPLLFALMAWAMAFVARALRNGWTLKLALGAGAFAGLAILTKTTGIALLPVLLVAAAIPQVKRPVAVHAAAAAVAVAVLAGPWLARNQVVYHDPLATKIFNKAFADTATKELIEQQSGGQGLGYWTNWVGWWTARSFIGVFGYMDIFLNESGTSQTQAGRTPNTLYRAALAALAILALGWLRSLGEPWAREGTAVTAVNATLIVVVATLFLLFNNMFFQGQARYLYPAIAPISVGFGSGVVAWSAKRSSIGIGVAAACLLGLVVYSGVRLPGEFAKRSTGWDASNGVPGSGVQ